MIENPPSTPPSGTELARYLELVGWRVVADTSPRIKRWAPGGDLRTPSVLVPLDVTAPDYTELLASAFRAASTLLGTSVSDTTRRVLLARGDVVRVTAEVDPAADGTIRISDGIQVLQSGFGVVEASSLAQGERRAYWGSRRPNITTQFMERIRLGLPQLGSYVVPLVIPLTFLEPANTDLALPNVEPYERSVTRTLVQAVNAAEAAAAQGMSGDLRPFQEAVVAGVSSNLCRAIGDLAAIPSLEGVRIDVEWAEVPELTPPDVRTSVRIARRLLPVLADAAAYLAPHESDRIVTVAGQVEHLDRAEDETEGTAGIRTTVDGGSRMVYADLSDELYSVAVQAHRAKDIVVCRGVLRIQGRRRFMTDVAFFRTDPSIASL